MLSIYQLMKYLRNTHNIAVKSTQAQALRNIGYYHGYKGYRFIREDSNRILFTSLDQIMALNRFDLKLKTLLYSKVMFIETALKNYVIEALLEDSRTEQFEEIYKKSLTAYKLHEKGSKAYKAAYVKRIDLKMKIDAALAHAYKKKGVVGHFFNNDREVPVWAIFEVLTLGDFGTLYSCANRSVNMYVSNILKLPTNLDSDGLVTQFFIFTIKDLRNAIAHNNVVFDTRFKTAGIDGRLIRLLESEVGIENLDFRYMDAYIIMIIYFLRKMGETKTECKRFVMAYNTQTECLRKEIPIDIYDKILGTGHKSNMIAALNYISVS